MACSGAHGPANGNTARPPVVVATGHNAGAKALDTARSMLGVAYRFGGSDRQGRLFDDDFVPGRRARDLAGTLLDKLEIRRATGTASRISVVASSIRPMSA